MISHHKAHAQCLTLSITIAAKAFLGKLYHEIYNVHILILACRLTESSATVEDEKYISNVMSQLNKDVQV